MSLLGKNTRKTVTPIASSSPVSTPISTKYLTLTDGNSTAHFKRLAYKNCPRIKSGSIPQKVFISNETIIDMNRWGFVEEMYEVISNIDRTQRTKLNIFNALIALVKFCDRKEISDCFSNKAIGLFVIELKDRYLTGIKGKTLQGIQNSIRVIIQELNLPNHTQLIELFYPFPNDTSPVKPYTDKEIKLLVKNLYKIVSVYRGHLLEGSVPIVFPLYDEIKLKKVDPSFNLKQSGWEKKLSTNNNKDTWKIDLVRSGYYLMCFFTGINNSQLLNLKITDITDRKFIESSRGKYILSTIKNRQKGRHNLDEIGFTSKAKDFLDSWLIIAKILDDSHEAYLFPKVIDGHCSQHNSSSILLGINHSFQALGLPRLYNTRFRKTKASLIMRATNSIFSVAEGLNNSPETVAKHYSDGDPVTTKMTLAAMLDVRERTAQGESLSNAKENSIFNYTDPVREGIHKESEVIFTPISASGIRCKSPFGEKSQKLKESLIDGGLAKDTDEVACHKFLECFGCNHHAIIAEVEDIWLMLSFRDVLLSVMARPSINSSPGEILVKISNTIESILLRLKTDFLDIYNLAMKRYMNAPHPLWSNENDFDLLLEVW